MSLGWTLVGCVLFFALFNAGVALRRCIASLGSCPRGGFFWSHPMKLLALALAPVFPPRGWLGHYNGRFFLYAKKGSTILSGVLLSCAKPIFWIADAEALKAITSDRQTFVKDLDSYVLVDIYGKSLVTTEGNEWRRHVAVAGPAFCESLNGLAWQETLRAVQEWFSEEVDRNVDDSTKPDSIPTTTVNALSKMTQLTLHVIAAAGFGMRAPWTTFSDMDTHLPSSEEMLPFHVALHSTLANLPVRVLAPPFLSSLPIRIPWVSEKLAVARNAFSCMKTHMLNLVGSVRNGSKAGNTTIKPKATGDVGADLLRRLVEANDIKDESGVSHRRALTDNELLSNIFTFLLAGHETSAHTLCFAILLLAVYPDVQMKVREEANRIWPTDDDVMQATYKNDFDKFEYTLAFFRETLRCFPTEPRLIKIASRDATVTGQRFRPAPDTASRVPETSFDGANTNVQFERNERSSEERFSAFIPEGSIIMLDIWGVQMNPFIWGSDAHEFRPERFIDTDEYKWPREGFLAFSSGARGCLGQRFALAEAVCVLANLVRRYEILPALDERSFTSREEFKRAMLGYSVALTITPTTKHVKFRRLSETVNY